MIKPLVSSSPYAPSSAASPRDPASIVASSAQNSPSPTFLLASQARNSGTSTAQNSPSTGGGRGEASYRSTSLKALGKEKSITPTTLFTSQLKDAKSHFSQDDLVKYWIEYANSLTIEKIHLKNTLNNCKPVLKEDFTFEVAVYNPSQKEEIFDNSHLLLGHLCEKLNNNRIKMDIRIVEKEEIEMIYTATEKYDYLLKKNPNIEKLKELFNLIME